jgi:uncharacterized membrane protein
LPRDVAIFLWRRPETTFVYSASATALKFVEPGRRSQRGAGKLKAIIFTVIFILAIFVAFKLVPPYVNEYQLQDKMQEVARFAIVNRYSDEQVRENMFKVVQDLDLPIKREEIKVYISQATCRISLDYTVPVDLMFYSTELHFSPASENKSIM